MDPERQKQLIADWKREEQQPFIGWDFSYLIDSGRMVEEDAPWSYTTRAGALMQQSAAVLDMDTGGGERLLMLRPHWPDLVVATEAYPPNVRLAGSRLRRHDAWLIVTHLREYDPMPFGDGVFNLVLNRHAAFNSDEVARILAPGGTFLTQQVHGLSLDDLQAAFDDTPDWPAATPERYVPWLERAGLAIIDVQEWTGQLAFRDVGALVYYLKAAPWLVHGFGVESHRHYLLALQQRVDDGEALAFRWRKYLIEARKLPRNSG